MAISYEEVAPLDVLNKYKALMIASTDKDSIYIKTKETLQSLFEDSTMTDREKATILSELLGGLTTSISTAALDAAIRISLEDRNAKYIIEKMKQDNELAEQGVLKLVADTEISTNNASSIATDEKLKRIDSQIKQANAYHDTGYKAFSDTKEAISTESDFDDTYGLKRQDEKTKRLQRYVAAADSVRNNGLVSYTQDSNGNITNYITDDNGMAHEQMRVTQRQVDAFDDNMRQHVLNSSASMLGVMISSEAFTDEASYTPYLELWKDAADFLNTSKNATNGTIVATFPTITTLPVDADLTVTCIATNVPMGSSVVVKAYGNNTVYLGTNVLYEITAATDTTAAIIGTTVTLSMDLVNDIVPNTDTNDFTLTASVIDQTGKRVLDQEVVAL